MTKEELLVTIESLMPILHQYRKSKTTDFGTLDKKLEMAEAYRTIYGVVNLDLACPTCINFYLEQLEAWYQRESAKQVKFNVNPAVEPKKKSIRKSKAKN